MAKGTREIRRKIKSIKNTRQITKAMEMVSASKMRRAVGNTLALRPYARLSRMLLQMLADKTGEEIHPLLAKREVKKALVIAIGSDRGLCGSLNAQLIRRLADSITDEGKKKNPPELHFVAIGKKVQEFLKRADQRVIAAFPAMSAKPTLKDTLPISRLVLQDYATGQYDKVMLVYTDYISALAQKPVSRRLLPFSRLALEEMVAGLESPDATNDVETDADSNEYLFEPSPEMILKILLPRLTEMQVYQSVLEAAASEHSARMVAMHSATDNATEFIDDLTLAYNQVRQASITRELAEISAGRAALG